MPPVIECCVRNLSERRQTRLRDSEGTLRVRPCLEHCGVCRESPFRIVGGELIVDDERRKTASDGEGDAE